MFESFEDENRFYIVTELCSGGELYDKVKTMKHMTDKEAAHIMHQILSVVNYCHSKSIVHRDLKPENVLFENPKGNHIKIIDFGTSRVFVRNQKMKQRFGTPFYVAPEVLNGVYDHKCDIWSCGVILYVLLSGKPPFYARSVDGVLEKVKKGQFTMEGALWNEVSSEAKDLIQKMLTLDPEIRISIPEALVHPWMEKMMLRETIGKELSSQVLENLNSFSVNQKLQQSLWVLMSSTMTTREEKNEMTRVFRSLDSNGDGHLSFDELVKGYTQLLGDQEEAENKVKSIMANSDINNSGSIDYFGSLSFLFLFNFSFGKLRVHFRQREQKAADYKGQTATDVPLDRQGQVQVHFSSGAQANPGHGERRCGFRRGLERNDKGN